MAAYRYNVWVQTETPDTFDDRFGLSSKIAEKTDNLEEAKRRAKVWASRDKVLSSRVWDSHESLWVYDAFEEFDHEKE